MTDKTVNQLTTEELQAELQKRNMAAVAEQRRRMEAEEKERQLAAEQGKREALIRVEEIKKELEALTRELDTLAKKHLLYVEWDIADGTLEFSRWGMSGSGWDSSNC